MSINNITDITSGGGYVGILIPVYNAEHFLRDCIDACLCQTYTKIKVIIVDDGSSDNSRELLNGYAQKDKRVCVNCNGTNKGVCYTRQKLVDIAKKERVDYIAFVDVDDSIHKDYIRVLVEIINKTNTSVGWVKGKYVPRENLDEVHVREQDISVFKENIEVLDSVNLLKDYKSVVQYNMLWGKIFKISCFDNVTFPVGENYIYFEDGATTFKILYYARNVAHVSVDLYYSIGNVNSMTRSQITIQRLDDAIKSSLAAVNFYKEQNENELIKCAAVQLLQSIIMNLESCYFKLVNNSLAEFKKQHKIYKTYYKQIKNAPNLSKSKRIQFLSIYYLPKFVMFLKYKIFRRKQYLK